MCYVDKNGDEQVFDASCADKIIEVRDWTWYGNDQGDSEPNSLRIWSGFSFDTASFQVTLGDHFIYGEVLSDPDSKEIPKPTALLNFRSANPPSTVALSRR